MSSTVSSLPFGTSLKRPSVDLQNNKVEIGGRSYAMLKEPHHVPNIPLTASAEVTAVLKGSEFKEDSLTGAEPRGLHLDCQGNPQLIDTSVGKTIVAAGEGFSYYFTKFVDWARESWAHNGPIWQAKVGAAANRAGEAVSRAFTKSVDYSREKLAETGDKLNAKFDNFQERRRSAGGIREVIRRSYTQTADAARRSFDGLKDRARHSIDASKQNADHSMEIMREKIADDVHRQQLTRASTLPAGPTPIADQPILMQADPIEVPAAADADLIRPVNTTDLRTANSGAAEVVGDKSQAKPLTEPTQQFVRKSPALDAYLGKSGSKDFHSMHKSLNPANATTNAADKELMFDEESRIF